MYTFMLYFSLLTSGMQTSQMLGVQNEELLMMLFCSIAYQLQPSKFEDLTR